LTATFPDGNVADVTGIIETWHMRARTRTLRASTRPNRHAAGPGNASVTAAYGQASSIIQTNRARHSSTYNSSSCLLSELEAMLRAQRARKLDANQQHDWCSNIGSIRAHWRLSETTNCRASSPICSWRNLHGERDIDANRKGLGWSRKVTNNLRVSPVAIP